MRLVLARAGVAKCKLGVTFAAIGKAFGLASRAREDATKADRRLLSRLLVSLRARAK